MHKKNVTKEYIQKTREYLDYLERHINNVEKSWRLLKETCQDMRFCSDDFVFHMIDQQVKVHDLSKLTEYEFVQYRRKFFACGEMGEWVQKDFEKAWKHHEKENEHHWQNWTKIKDNSPYRWEVNCVHMVIDWMAMGIEFGDTAKEYYESNSEKIDLPDYAVNFIYVIFNRIYN